MGKEFQKAVILVTGYYGSGKTSFALSLAERLVKEGRPPAIVDLDVVNPYFRTFDYREQLQAEGIRVEAPVYAGTNLDIPALPPSIDGLIERATESSPVILDLGGDDAGAAVLGRYKAGLLAAWKRDELAVLHLVNFRRALTPDAQSAAEEAAAIGAACGFMPTAVINSTNLGPETTGSTLLDSLDEAEALGRQLGVPVEATVMEPAVWQGLTPEQQAKIPRAFLLTRRVKLPWE